MTDGQITLLGKFSDTAQEARYQARTLESTRIIGVIISSVALFACIGFLPNDIINGQINYPALVPRLILAGISVTCLYLTIGPRTQGSIYLAAVLLSISVMSLDILIVLSRPPDYLLHIGTDIVILLGAYILLPTLALQLPHTVSFSVALIGIHYFHKQPTHDMANVTIPLTIVLANFIGLGMSVLYGRTRHQMFAQLEDLQRTQEHVDTLTKLIPMCSSCKSIRNDDGYWEQVETYMKETSGAEVSHGVCPDCARKLYNMDISTDA